MDLRDRIDAALLANVLDPRDFERCATSLLRTEYPTLSPVTGGTDLGRDADLEGLSYGPRLLATVGPPLSNLKRGLTRLRKEGVPSADGVVVATSRVVHAKEREKLAAEATRQGSRLIQVYDRTWLADRLQSDSYWRRRLLRLSSEPSALVLRPIELRRYGEDLELVGRAELLRSLSAGADAVAIGPPGIGKTRLLAELDRVAFLESSPDPGRLAEDLDDIAPAVVVVEDAARRADDLRLLQRLRLEESGRNFRIVATAWLDEAEDVLERLDGGDRVLVDLLERPQMDAILRQLGVTGHWHRWAILDQAGGRPGWAVVLARATVEGQSGSVFDGRVLTRQVEHYLRASGDQDEKERVLAHVAVYDGVAEEDLGALSARLGMSLPSLTRVLHATTHNGILERVLATWYVRPEALRVALIDRWFLVADAPEPMPVLLREYPRDETALVTACLEAARRGSRRGREIARARVPTLTADQPLSAAALELLTLYADIDREAAQWTVTQRILPALAAPDASASSRASVRGILETIVDRYQVAEAVALLLDEAATLSLDTNDFGHPVRILGEAAARILPEFGPDPQRRARIFGAAVRWLDRDPSQARWLVFVRLVKSVLSPHIGGTWGDPGKPMTFTFAQGVDSPGALTLIATELWPELASRLPHAPDEAVLDVIDVVADWSRVARGLSAFQSAPSRRQQTVARQAVQPMIAALDARTASAPGLRVRCLRHLNKHAARFRTGVPAQFLILTEDSAGTSAWAAQKGRYQALARRWMVEGPAAVLGRLHGWQAQLRLVGRGQTAEWAVLVTLAEEIEDSLPWVAETVRLSLPAGSAFFYATLRRCDADSLPDWFHRALADSALRLDALSAALRPGVPAQLAAQAVELLRAADAEAIRRGLLERDAVDPMVSLLLRHGVPEVRLLTALELIRPDGTRPPMAADDEGAWEAAITGCASEPLSAHYQSELGQALEQIASSNPERAAQWFRDRIARAGDQYLSEAIPSPSRSAFGRLPTSIKLELLGLMPVHWKHLLFHDGVAGANPDWVVDAVDAGRLSVSDAARALDDVDEATFRRVAPQLVRRGLEPRHALAALEAGSRFEEESKYYARLVALCSDLAGSVDAELVRIGDAGLAQYTRLRDEAMVQEHRERVFGV